MLIVTPSRNLTNRVRANLFLDHVSLLEAISEGLRVEHTQMYQNDVYILSDPLYVPDLNMYVFNKISDGKDKRLYSIIFKLLWLNPYPDEFLQKKLSEYVVNHFISTRTGESGVSSRPMQVPVLPHEFIAKVVKYIMGNYDPRMYKPDKKVYHLLNSTNTLTKNQKISVSRQVRSRVHKEFIGSMIDNAVDALIEYDHWTKVTTGRVHNKQLVTKADGQNVSYNTINRNATDYARRRMSETNTYRLFNDEILSVKLSEYLNSDALTLDQITERYAISKKTALTFNQIKHERSS